MREDFRQEVCHFVDLMDFFFSCCAQWKKKKKHLLVESSCGSYISDPSVTDGLAELLSCSQIIEMFLQINAGYLCHVSYER